MTERMEIVLISDRKILAGEDLWKVMASAAGAGLTAFMLREKDLPGRALLALAREIVARCRPMGVRVIVNDRVDVALAAGADGVHLGGDAIPADAARRIAGGRLRIGVSTHSIEEIRAAARAGADYAIFGPVFETPSKLQYGAPQGVENLRGGPARGHRGRRDRARQRGAAPRDGNRRRRGDPGDSRRTGSGRDRPRPAVGPRPGGDTLSRPLLCIGGYDPSGGAGVIADLRAARAAGCGALAVVSTLTAQSSGAVRGAR